MQVQVQLSVYRPNFSGPTDVPHIIWMTTTSRSLSVKASVCCKNRANLLRNEAAKQAKRVCIVFANAICSIPMRSRDLVSQAAAQHVN